MSMSQVETKSEVQIPIPSFDELLKSGVHIGHLRRKWNPKMRPYIFAEHKGIHIIDLNKTRDLLQKATQYVYNVAKQNKKILFVATKSQASSIVRQAAESVNMPYVTERWLGGMLTNFATIRRSVRKMENIERILKDESVTTLTKKERLLLQREKAKLQKVLGGVLDLTRLPTALYIVDIHYEHLAVKEALRLGIPTVAMVDTNTDPTLVDFPIPANDDSAYSIKIITQTIANAIRLGQEAAQEDSMDMEDDF